MDNASSDNNLITETFESRAADNRLVSIRFWQPLPGNAPKAVIQILHGLGEHVGRYDRFARACVKEGFAVAAHNHRGHGEDGPDHQPGHFANEDGWNKVIADALLVRQLLLDRYRGVPLVVLGHSMGSYIAQCSVMRDSNGVAQLVLSATTDPSRFKLRIARFLARMEIMRTGGDVGSKFLNKASFGDFNKRFAPNRSNFDWLSRDENEVDKYIADPACGVLSTSQLWSDLTGGLLEISTSEAIRSVPGKLPILITGGELDPVGGEAGLTRLADRYRHSDHSDITLRIYAGGRHEMLNEINRDEVTMDIVRWILGRTL